MLNTSAETKNGLLVLANANAGTLGRLALETATGKPDTLEPFKNNIAGRDPDVTPDGKTVVYTLPFTPHSIYSAPMDDSAAPKQLTPNDLDDPTSTKEYPTVSPDGETVFFQYNARDNDGNTLINDIYSVPIGGGDMT